MPELDALGVAVKLARALESAQIDYAIGGAIALGFATEPRGTIDVDLIAFVDPNSLAHLFETLTKTGCDLDPTRAVEQARQRFDFRTRCHGIRVDVFLPSFELYAAAKQRRRRVALGDQQLWIWSPEDLAVFKILFNRGKDWVDVESLLVTGGQAFDRDYVRAWIVELMGAHDDRVADWDQLCRNIDASFSARGSGPGGPRHAGL